MPDQRFSYGRTLYGYEVIDNQTGRPVSASYRSARAANGRAYQLNEAAKHGPKDLILALQGGRRWQPPR